MVNKSDSFIANVLWQLWCCSNSSFAWGRDVIKRSIQRYRLRDRQHFTLLIRQSNEMLQGPSYFRVHNNN